MDCARKEAISSIKEALSRHAENKNIYRQAEPQNAQIYSCTKSFIQELKESEYLSSPSDLVSGVYEGGFKVWECTQDLLQLLQSNELSVQGLSVLDVGCGPGLLGIKCLLQGAKNVVFQDYNLQVIESCTLANLILNLKLKYPESNIDELVETWMSKCKLLACDWSEFDAHQDKFDVIISSETIYNEDNYSKLTNLFRRSLAKDGRVIVGCKSHYFGVGGGSDSFQDHLREEGSFECKVIKEINTPLRRDILELRLIQ